MKTKNQYFNRAWEEIAKCHSSANLPNGESIDLSEYPVIPKKDWPNYVHALGTIFVIGRRNGYLHIHQDGKGREVYLYVPKEKEDE